MLTSRQEGDLIRVSGFVGTEEALQILRRDYPSPSYELDVELRPWPQCEILMTLYDQLKAAGAPKLSVKDGSTAFTKGESLALEIMAPSKPAYVYISYVQADGKVVHLHEPPGPVAVPTQSNTRFLFGDGLEGRSRFTVSGPFGNEMVIVLASASPLFESPLPVEQMDRDYLSMVRKALVYKADPNQPDREVSAAFLGIETREN